MKLSRDLSPGLLHPRENLFIVGNLGALNANIAIESDGCSSVALDLRGTFVGTVQLQGTVDGVNWQLIPLIAVNVASVLWATGATAAGTYFASLGPYRNVRAIMTAYTSGLAIANLSPSLAQLDPVLLKSVTSITATNTGAGGAAVTLSLPQPGAGLRHYLTYLAIARFCSTGPLTAAATPVIVTTTNIPGAMVIPFAADAATLGQMDRWREDFAYAIAASAQATATTFVCPATTGVIWRVTAGYFVAP